jgi:hypothetical protein
MHRPRVKASRLRESVARRCSVYQEALVTKCPGWLARAGRVTAGSRVMDRSPSVPRLQLSAWSRTTSTTATTSTCSGGMSEMRRSNSCAVRGGRRGPPRLTLGPSSAHPDADGRQTLDGRGIGHSHVTGVNVTHRRAARAKAAAPEQAALFGDVEASSSVWPTTVSELRVEGASRPRRSTVGRRPPPIVEKSGQLRISWKAREKGSGSDAG